MLGCCGAPFKDKSTSKSNSVHYIFDVLRILLKEKIHFFSHEDTNCIDSLQGKCLENIRYYYITR